MKIESAVDVLVMKMVMVVVVNYVDYWLACLWWGVSRWWWVSLWWWVRTCWWWRRGCAWWWRRCLAWWRRYLAVWVIRWLLDIGWWLWDMWWSSYSLPWASSWAVNDNIHILLVGVLVSSASLTWPQDRASVSPTTATSASSSSSTSASSSSVSVKCCAYHDWMVGAWTRRNIYTSPRVDRPLQFRARARVCTFQDLHQIIDFRMQVLLYRKVTTRALLVS